VIASIGAVKDRESGSELLTIREFASRLRISYPTAQRWIADDVIDSVRCGRTVRVSLAVVEAFIEAGGARALRRAKAEPAQT
jgi:excisionase family DNA binding protein